MLKNQKIIQIFISIFNTVKFFQNWVGSRIRIFDFFMHPELYDRYGRWQARKLIRQLPVEQHKQLQAVKVG